VFRLLVLDAVFACGNQVAAQAFMALGRPGIVTILQSLSVALMLGLMAALVPVYGLTGVGLALLIGSVVRLVGTFFCLSEFLGVGPLEMLLPAREAPELVPGTVAGE
jgi:O-antigen/teichoic acid export membrane protein